MDWTSLESIGNMIGPVFSHQMTQAGLAFTIAAWFHSGRVKSEIRSQSVLISEAFNNLAQALRQDMNNLNSRVTALEKKKE